MRSGWPDRSEQRQATGIEAAVSDSHSDSDPIRVYLLDDHEAAIAAPTAVSSSA